MSRLMIILLILILLIRSSNSNDVKINEFETKGTIDVKNQRNLLPLKRVHHIGLNVSKDNDNTSRMKSNKLRHDLQNLLSTMVKKIIEQRRSKVEKKWQIRRNKGNINFDKMIEKNKITIGKIAIENNLESGKGERRDGDDYNVIIGQTIEKISDNGSKDLSEVSENPVPLVRGNNVRSWIRKVRRNFTRIKPGIDVANESVIWGNFRGKRQSENDSWIKKDFEGHGESFKMHALVVRDEDIPPCCSPAKAVTNRRYFMCSGAVLTLKHAITTASCMHFADIYEHEIDADLGILVGATNPRAYVTKINRYEMHPDYDYDVDSKDHATNNIALIYLECSLVPEDVVIPMLPKGINDDVGHMCCREGCDVITIVQSADNRHTARLLKAKHLPAPRHDNEVANNGVSEKITNESAGNQSSVPSRGIRSPLKLAAAPILFGKEPRGTSNNRSSRKNGRESLVTKKRRKGKTLEISRAKNQQRGGKKNERLNLDDFVDRGKSRGEHIPILRALEAEGANVEEQLTAVDWEKIEETMSKKFSDENREAMEIFAKNVVDETIKRLDTVLGDGDSSNDPNANGDSKDNGILGSSNASRIFAKLMPGNKKNGTIGSFVEVFTKVVSSLVPPNSGSSIIVSSDSLVEEKDLEDPSPIYEKCPPLGAPVIIDGMLVGLLAYTCDDVQNWVEWKYVNVAKNMIWIRKKMTDLYEPSEKCSETEKSSPQARSVSLNVENNVSIDNYPWTENQTDIRDVNVDWTEREITDERRNVFPRNLDDARIPSMTETSLRIVKDPWSARNSQFTPRERFAERIFGNSRNQPKISVLRHVPVYNINTCYVKADGTTDCQTRTEFNIR